MKQLKFNPKKDMKELEKYGYTRYGGTEEEHYHWGYYVKKLHCIFSRQKCVVIPFRGNDKGYPLVKCWNIYKEDFENEIVNPMFKKRYVKDLIKADLLIVEEVRK